MTPQQADKIIKAGKPVRVRQPHWGPEVYTMLFIRRDRRHIYTTDNSFDRGDLEIAT